MSHVTAPKIKCVDCKKYLPSDNVFYPGEVVGTCPKRRFSLQGNTPRYCIDFEYKKCKRCGLEAQLITVDGYCAVCTGEILREKNPSMNIHFAGDMADLFNKHEGA